MKSNVRSRICAIFISIGVIGIFAPLGGSARAQGTTRQLGHLLSACTAQHAYSVSQSEALGAYELGVGELAWRSCVYDGIRRMIIPNTPVPDLFKKLIANDKAMTARIGKKELTRKERRITNLRAIMVVQEREDKYLRQREKLLREQAKTANSIREVENILEIQRRAFEISRSALEGLR